MVAIAGICFLAFISLGSSIRFAINAESDAAAINIAGSLRMQSWRLSEQVLIPELTSQYALDKLILIYDNSIDHLALSRLQPREDEIGMLYRSVVREWYRVMRPLLRTPEGYQQFIDKVPDFVDRIDLMVKALQLDTERRLSMLMMIAATSLLGILVISFAVIHFIRRNLLEPINKLGIAATKVRQGDFDDLDLSFNAKNEIGRLTQTFRTMANDLGGLYETLEDKVEEQTRALAQSNTALQILYDSSRTLGVNPYDEQEVSRLVEDWKQLLNLESCYLCLSDIADSQKLLRIDHHQTKKACAGDCLECINKKQTSIEQGWQFPLSIEGQSFGFLNAVTENDQPLPEESRQWLRTFADIVATSLHHSSNSNQERRILLMEERAVIARELHDSLAQALSYQKIQVVRLKRQLAKLGYLPEVAVVLGELQEGLNNAYRQLRELLRTFRLSVADGSLEQALQSTLAEYQSREPNIDFILDYQLRYCSLDAHFQIHIVQIVREALANAVKHAGAHEVQVNCQLESPGMVLVTIDDDGKGISDAPGKVGHFGTTIMKERASSLGGTLKYEQAPQGGARVSLAFEVA